MILNNFGDLSDSQISLKFILIDTLHGNVTSFTKWMPWCYDIGNFSEYFLYFLLLAPTASVLNNLHKQGVILRLRISSFQIFINHEELHEDSTDLHQFAPANLIDSHWFWWFSVILSDSWWFLLILNDFQISLELILVDSWISLTLNLFSNIYKSWGFAWRFNWFALICKCESLQILIIYTWLERGDYQL